MSYYEDSKKHDPQEFTFVMLRDLVRQTAWALKLTKADVVGILARLLDWYEKEGR